MLPIHDAIHNTQSVGVGIQICKVHRFSEVENLSPKLKGSEVLKYKFSYWVLKSCQLFCNFGLQSYIMRKPREMWKKRIRYHHNHLTPYGNNSLFSHGLGSLKEEVIVPSRVLGV